MVVGEVYRKYVNIKFHSRIKMNLAVSRITVQFTSVSSLKHLSQCFKHHPIRSSVKNSSLVISRGNFTRNNLVYNKRKVWYDPAEEPIGVYGWSLLGIPIITLGLGIWQIQRRKWKLDLIESMRTKTAAPAVDLPMDFNDLKEMEYCAVKMKGEFLYNKEFTVGPRSLIVNGDAATTGGLITQGSASTGHMVITPFKLEGREDIIMVNRGWVPRAKQSRLKRPNDRVDGIVEITGVVRLNEPRPQFVPHNDPENGTWYYRDVNMMAEYAGTAPVYVDLVTNLNTENGPIPGQTRVTLRNDHASYIFTWFSLSLVTGWMWHRMFIRKLPLL